MALVVNITMVLMSTIGTLLNGAVSFIIGFNHTLRRRKSNKLLLNLLLSDMCVSLAMLIYSSANITATVMNFEAQLTFAFLVSVLMFLSLGNLIVLTLDRLVAIKWSFFYQNNVKTKHVYFIISATWMVSILYFATLLIIRETCSTKFAFDMAHFSFLSVIIAGFIVTLTSNIVIYIEAKKQLTAISKTVVAATLSKAERSKNVQRRKECRLVRVSMGMVISFAVFWLPAVISCSYFKANGEFVSTEYNYISWCLVCINYISDPIIYVTLSKDVKDQIRMIIRRRNVEADASYTIESSTL